MSNVSRRSLLVYGILVIIWGTIIGWQAAEHLRVRANARTALVNRARDITSTLGLVMRSQRRFGGIISKERLEPAMADLTKAGGLSSILLLNTEGEVVASAGQPVDLPTQKSLRTGVHWEDQRVTLANLVDLGSNSVSNAPSPTIVLNRQDFPGTNRPPVSRAEPPTNGIPGIQGAGPPNGQLGPPPPESFENRGRGFREGRSRGGSDGRPPFGRPFWMSEEEYQSVIKKQGVHSFLIVMPTASLQSTCNQDLWLRAIIAILATVSAFGCGLAWRNLTTSSELQIRLVRASELNTHLKEMNLAAAGLAHETRNPLNIVRGLAQLISKEEDAPPEVRKKSRAILEEVDRVTAQLNEFINYSRPREVRAAPVALGSVVSEVARALGYDLEEKQIKLQVFDDPLTILADEPLLRQAVFNLLLNATQAVSPGGEITVTVQRQNNETCALEIRDNGPGVPADQRTQIFKPYFTTNQQGTGLGLAVVQQIVSAHGWEIKCLANEPKGAIFRIEHLKAAPKS